MICQIELEVEMETDAQRREFVIRMVALACSAIALASCKHTIAGNDVKSPEPDDESGKGGNGGM